MWLVNVTLLFQEIDKFFYVLCFDESDEFSVFRDGEKGFSFIDRKHVADFLRDDDLSLGSDCDRSVHTDFEFVSWEFFACSKHRL